MKTAKEVLTRAKELEDELNKDVKAGEERTEVLPICLNISPDDQAIAFIKHPNYDEMCYAFEKMATGNAMDGAEAVLDRCLMKEESDARFQDKTHKKIRFTAVRECIQFVKGYENEVKKKSDSIPVR